MAKGSYSFALVDVVGRQLKGGELNISAEGSLTQTINCHAFSSGVYYLKIINGRQWKVMKFVLK